MERKEFLKACGFACVGVLLPGLVLQSCKGGKMVTAQMDDAGMHVPLSAFVHNGAYRAYIIAHNERLKYPVCIYRQSETEYMALLMRCTHQGTELQVFGDRLECPAHGSEFSKAGAVLTGPADTPLRTFTTTIVNNQLFIKLS
jgi:Rieske Fe-S protein